MKVKYNKILDIDWSKKLTPSLFDKIFRKGRFKEVNELRSQIIFMLYKFENIDIWRRLSKYSKVYSEINSKYLLYTFNERVMYRVEGEQAVINRLRSDRNYIYNKLKGVEDIDLSDISNLIRQEKINKVIE